MKLYYYDHCPFCTRVRMVANYFAMPLTEVALLNDDDATPNRLIGKKMVPILEKDDGHAIGESLDIVNLLAGERLNPSVRDPISDWLNTHQRLMMRLWMPRCVQLGLVEFATDSAVAYFVEKKSAVIGDFDECLAHTEKDAAALNDALNTLATWIAQSPPNDDEMRMEDVLLFPVLRNLTMVEALIFPEAVMDYLSHWAQKTQLSLFFK